MNIDIRFSVTESASAELKKMFASEFIRLSAKPSGCSKTVYGLLPTDSRDPDDIVEDISGVKFVVDRNSLLRLDGVQLDFVNAWGEEGFLFSESNPDKKCSTEGKCCRKGGCS